MNNQEKKPVVYYFKKWKYYFAGVFGVVIFYTFSTIWDIKDIRLHLFSIPGWLLAGLIGTKLENKFLGRFYLKIGFFLISVILGFFFTYGILVLFTVYAFIFEFDCC